MGASSCRVVGRATVTVLLGLVPAIALAVPAAAPRGVALRAPEIIYAKTCGYCHGTNVGPLIRGRGLPPEMIIQFVRSGPGAMTAFRQTEITDAELRALAEWVSKSKADPKEHGQ